MPKLIKASQNYCHPLLWWKRKMSTQRPPLTFQFWERSRQYLKTTKRKTNNNSHWILQWPIPKPSAWNQGRKKFLLFLIIEEKINAWDAFQVFCQGVVNFVKLQKWIIKKQLHLILQQPSILRPNLINWSQTINVPTCGEKWSY